MGLNSIIGERVKTLRDQAGWSGVALAKKIGVSSSYLGNLEKGKARWNAQLIEATAAAFGVSPTWLVGGARRSGLPTPAFDPSVLVEAVQRRDPSAILSALTQIVSSIPPSPAGRPEDPTRAELIAAYDRRDWRRLMQLAGQLADRWDR